MTRSGSVALEFDMNETALLVIGSILWLDTLICSPELLRMGEHIMHLPIVELYKLVGGITVSAPKRGIKLWNPYLKGRIIGSSEFGCLAFTTSSI
jgi:hypothetical protein